MGRNSRAMARDRPPDAGGPPPRLVTRPLLVRFVSTLGAAASFYLLLSAVPGYARSAGASPGTAGLTTSALTLASVAAYPVIPRLMARYGYRPMLAAGLGALGAPALLLAVSANVAVIMIVCVVRGVGFAVTCVAGYALTVSLIPPQRRGEGLALAGVMTGVPAVAALPLGVWLSAHAGYRPVFLVGGLAALAGLASVPWLPRPVPSAGRPTGILAALRAGALIRPALAFCATAMAVGIVVTFLPLAVPRTAADVAALALLVQPAAATAARWMAGRAGDRRGPAVMLRPGVLLAAAGMLTVSLTAVPAAVIGGAALFGLGFGVTQNSSLTLMYDRVPESGYGAVAALWNLAYDGGMGVGAAGFGMLAVHTGYPVAFALTAVVPPAVLALAGATGRAGNLRHYPERSWARASGRLSVSWSPQHRPVPVRTGTR